MPVVVQICIVVVTVAIVAAAVALIRALSQVKATVAQLERTMLHIDESIPTILRTVEETRGALDSFSNVAERVDRFTGWFEHVGGRAARFSNMVVTDVLEPASHVVAVVRGVRTGASVLLNGLFRKRIKSNAGTGGNHDE